MLTKCMILILMMASWQNTASPHIVTPAVYPKLPLQFCMKHLPIIVTKFLCTVSDDMLSDQFEDMALPILKRWNSEEINFKTCCTRPCTLDELLSLC
ncbi:hypothetical protein O3G_MSEX007146 [Manduca sexta]|uniref:Uncharacterized protein n=1 Tax=Manduca sexta TaxID=7130 RepID=A0A921Z5D1_MANSE|nr:hypothetical protein O3G_MSEX007146 [Manduca sexta]KAG6451464.1 hypothetical protein O3G_MSEX007146 [Manduca sexta]